MIDERQLRALTENMPTNVAVGVLGALTGTSLYMVHKGEKKAEIARRHITDISDIHSVFSGNTDVHLGALQHVAHRQVLEEQDKQPPTEGMSR